MNDAVREDRCEPGRHRFWLMTILIPGLACFSLSGLIVLGLLVRQERVTELETLGLHFHYARHPTAAPHWLRDLVKTHDWNWPHPLLSITVVTGPPAQLTSPQAEQLVKVMNERDTKRLILTKSVDDYSLFLKTPDLQEVWAFQLNDRELATIARHPSLQVLVLDGTSITDHGLQALRHARQLELLSLERTSITDAGIAAIETLPHLRVLNVSQTAVSSDCLPSLERMPSLQVLHASQTHISESRLEELSNRNPDFTFDND